MLEELKMESGWDQGLAKNLMLVYIWRSVRKALTKEMYHYTKAQNEPWRALWRRFPRRREKSSRRTASSTKISWKYRYTLYLRDI